MHAADYTNTAETDTIHSLEVPNRWKHGFIHTFTGWSLCVCYPWQISKSINPNIVWMCANIGGYEDVVKWSLTL